MTVERIIKEKGNYVSTVTPDVKIADVIDALEADDVGALVVSPDGNKIDGIISERDVVRGLQKFGAAVLDHAVGELMTTDVVTCTEGDPVVGVMAVMDNRGFRHVPVTDDGKLTGIVTIRDIIKLRLNEVQGEADAMRDYIRRA